MGISSEFYTPKDLKEELSDVNRHLYRLDGWELRFSIHSCRIADIAEVCFHEIADDHRPGTRDEPLKTSAWEAIGTLATTFYFSNIDRHVEPNHILN